MDFLVICVEWFYRMPWFIRALPALPVILFRLSRFMLSFYTSVSGSGTGEWGGGARRKRLISTYRLSLKIWTFRKWSGTWTTIEKVNQEIRNICQRFRKMNQYIWLSETTYEIDSFGENLYCCLSAAWKLVEGRWGKEIVVLQTLQIHEMIVCTSHYNWNCTQDELLMWLLQRWIPINDLKQASK